MANGQSEYKLALEAAAASRQGSANWNGRLTQTETIDDAITILGNETVSAYHDLGPAGMPFVLVPEHSRVRYDGTGTINCAFKLQKVIGTTRSYGASFTRSTTTATVTLPDHGFVTNQVLAVTASSSEAAIVIGNVTITRTGKNTFTFTCLNAGDASGTLTIGPAAGSVVDLTAAVTCDGTNVEGFAVVNNGPPSPVAADDTLRATFTDVTTIPATRRLLLEIGARRRSA